MAKFQLCVECKDGETVVKEFGDHLDLAVEEFGRYATSMAYEKVLLWDMEKEVPRLYGIFFRDGEYAIRTDGTPDQSGQTVN